MQPGDSHRGRPPLEHAAGKVAFITGGSSGTGLGIARAFVAAGMKVAIGYRTQDHIEAAQHYFGTQRDAVHAIRVDVTNRSQLEKAASEAVEVFGKIHVLVNNAGVFSAKSVQEMSFGDWDWLIDVNLNGVFNGVRTFLPHLLNHGEGGQIITTSSTLGLLSGAGMVAYSASKFAVVGMMEALRADLLPHRIGVSVFCPGTVNTSIADSVRNRPQYGRGANPGATSAEPMNATPWADPETSMDPLKAGEIVLQGMRRNDLYILSHSEFASQIQLRHDALMASLPEKLAADHPRVTLASRALETSVYWAERERRGQIEPDDSIG